MQKRRNGDNNNSDVHKDRNRYHENYYNYLCNDSDYKHIRVCTNNYILLALRVMLAYRYDPLSEKLLENAVNFQKVKGLSY